MADRQAMPWRTALAVPGVVCLLGVTAACGPTRKEEADLIIRNARVRTMDPAQPWADAVAILGDRVLRVGKESAVFRTASQRTRIFDAGGRLVLPGFIDSHNHITFGSDPDVVQLAEARTARQLEASIRRFAASRPELEWIEGEGWNYSVFPGGRLPTWRNLEALTGGRPAFLVSYDAHTVWLNRAALKKLGVDRDTTRLAFGEIDRDPRSGEPTGLLGSFATMGHSKEGQQALRTILPSWSIERV